MFTYSDYLYDKTISSSNIYHELLGDSRDSYFKNEYIPVSYVVVHDSFDSSSSYSKRNIKTRDSYAETTAQDESSQRESFQTKHKKIIDERAAELSRIVRKDEYIEGENSLAQIYMERLFVEDPDIFFYVYQKTWIGFFDRDKEIELYKFISFSSAIPYEYLGDFATALILSACANRSCAIREAAIRAAECWGRPEHAVHLEAMSDFNEKWLNNYKSQVIEYLKG